MCKLAQASSGTLKVSRTNFTSKYQSGKIPSNMLGGGCPVRSGFHDHLYSGNSNHAPKEFTAAILSIERFTQVD
jgi:hypothetical protein